MLKVGIGHALPLGRIMLRDSFAVRRIEEPVLVLRSGRRVEESATRVERDDCFLLALVPAGVKIWIAEILLSLPDRRHLDRCNRRAAHKIIFVFGGVDFVRA